MALSVSSLNLTLPKSSPFTVPMRIEVKQNIQSNKASEEVDFTYSFDDDHDIFFDTPDGPAKVATRTEDAVSVATMMCHRFPLVRGEGNRLVSYELRQKVVDEANRSHRRRKTLRIE